jgi:DNA-binding NarL/FixJ family response regulator
LIIDEHEAVRQALESRLRSTENMDVVGCTGCWQEGIDLAVEQSPDVVLLETKRSDGEGIIALRRLRTECPDTRIVVLTSYSEPTEQEEAMEAGAVRYLLKEIGSSYLVQEIHTVVDPRALV